MLGIGPLNNVPARTALTTCGTYSSPGTVGKTRQKLQYSTCARLDVERPIRLIAYSPYTIAPLAHATLDIIVSGT